MSRILLVATNMTTDPYPVYPIGMATVASALVARGHEVRQFDFLAKGRSEKELANAINDFAPEYIGLSLRNIDTVDSCNPDNTWYPAFDKLVMETIKKTTQVPIILGGPAFSILPEEMLEYLGGDYGVCGEGEYAACKLIADLNEGLATPRIIYSNREQLPVMHPPLWEQHLIDFYVKESGIINLQTKRGCPYKCTYCTYPALEGNTLRCRAPDEVVDTLDKLKRVYGVDSVYFTDSIFNDEDGHYLEIAEMLISRDVRIKWTGFFRPSKITRNEMHLLKKSGLYAIEAGSDASTDDTLYGLDKQLTFDDILEFNNICVETRIPCAHYIMFGGPGETGKTLQEGLHNLEMLSNCMVFGFSGIRIFPQTRLRNQAIRDGIVTKEDPLIKPTYYFSPGIDDIGKMNAAIEENFKGRRDRIFPPSEGLMKLKTMNRLGYRGLLWDRLVSFRTISG